MIVTNIILADDHQIILDGLCSLLNDQKHLKVVGKVNNGTDLIKEILST